MNRLKLMIIVTMFIATSAQAAPIIEIGTPIFTKPVTTNFNVGDTVPVACESYVSVSYPAGESSVVFCKFTLKVNDVAIAYPNWSGTANPDFYQEVTFNASFYVALPISYTLEAIVEVWYDNGNSYQSASTELIIETVKQVDIDIKPGSTPNTINLGSNGVIPVAILSSAEFDAPLLVDTTTVQLQGKAGVRVKGNGDPLATERDVNGDGYIDLELKIEVENLEPGDIQDGIAEITGQTIDGQEFAGTDQVTIVPPE